MGYPKWQNGTSQMVVWGMRNGGSGHRNKGAKEKILGVEGREMGFIGLVTRAQKCEKEKKKKPFCKFQGLQNGIIFEKIAQKSQVGESPPNFYFTVYQCSTKFTHLFHLISFDKVIKYILQPSESRRKTMNRKERKRTCF